MNYLEGLKLALPRIEAALHTAMFRKCTTDGCQQPVYPQSLFQRGCTDREPCSRCTLCVGEFLEDKARRCGREPGHPSIYCERCLGTGRAPAECSPGSVVYCSHATARILMVALRQLDDAILAEDAERIKRDINTFRSCLFQEHGQWSNELWAALKLYPVLDRIRACNVD